MLWCLLYGKIKKISTSLYLSVITPIIFFFFFFLTNNTVTIAFLLFSFSLSIFCEPPLPDGFCIYHLHRIALVKIIYPLCFFIGGQFSDLILFDLSKAFDTGNHDFVKPFPWLLSHHAVLGFPLVSFFLNGFADFSLLNTSLASQAPRDHPWALPPLCFNSYSWRISAFLTLLPSVCWQLPDLDLSPGLQALSMASHPASCFACHLPHTRQGILPGVWGKIFEVAFDFLLCYIFNLPRNPLNLYSYRLCNGNSFYYI